MKTNRSLIIFLATFLLSIPLKTEASDEDKNVSTDPIILKGKGKFDPITRPRVPSRQMIVCTYNGEELIFDFTISEGLCEVTLTDLNTSMSSYYTIDSSELSASIYVGTIGESEIEVSTESGNTYTGTLLSE